MRVQVVNGLYLIVPVGFSPDKPSGVLPSFSEDGLKFRPAGQILFVSVENQDADDIDLSVQVWGSRPDDVSPFVDPGMWSASTSATIKTSGALEIRTLEHAFVEEVATVPCVYDCILVERKLPASLLVAGDIAVQQNLLLWPR